MTPDQEGAAAAGAMGLGEPWMSMSGDDGTVHWLEDGRMLKITSSKVEAAICLALLDLQASGHSHPCLPRIDGIGCFEVDVDLSPHAEGTLPLTRYAIVRESFDDHFQDGGEASLMDHALSLAKYGWVNDHRPSTDEAAAVWGNRGRQITDVIDGIAWLKGRTGILIGDVRVSNVGQSAAGRSGMRDLGRGSVPPEYLQRVDGGDIPVLDIPSAGDHAPSP